MELATLFFCDLSIFLFFVRSQRHIYSCRKITVK